LLIVTENAGGQLVILIFRALRLRSDKRRCEGESIDLSMVELRTTSARNSGLFSN
jgi:hypothetical protein